MSVTLEWSGALLGLLGAYLIATHGRYARLAGSRSWAPTPPWQASR